MVECNKFRRISWKEKLTKMISKTHFISREELCSLKLFYEDYNLRMKRNNSLVLNSDKMIPLTGRVSDVDGKTGCSPVFLG